MWNWAVQAVRALRTCKSEHLNANLMTDQLIRELQRGLLQLLLKSYYPLAPRDVYKTRPNEALGGQMTNRI